MFCPTRYARHASALHIVRTLAELYGKFMEIREDSALYQLSRIYIRFDIPFWSTRSVSIKYRSHVELTVERICF